GPHGVAGEIGQLQLAPRRFQAMAGERGARLLQLFDQFSVLALERDSVRLESRPCAISQERVVGGPFAPRADRHVGLANHTGMPLEAPEGSASVEMHGNGLKLIPRIQAAMGPPICRS